MSTPTDIHARKIANNMALIQKRLSVKPQEFNCVQNYMEAKKLFVEAINSDKSLKRFTRNSVHRLIENVKMTKKIVQLTGISSREQKILNLYDVIKENGEEHLVIAKIPATTKKTHIKVVPWEDCFEIFANLHKTHGHCGRDKLFKLIENKFYLLRTILNVFLSACCGEKRWDVKRNKSVAQVEIVNVNKWSDEEFCYVLLYVDNYSKYMLLRPLILKTYQETALELLKIFFDFGPPREIISNNNRYFQKVMEYVIESWPIFNIRLSKISPKMYTVHPHYVIEMLNKLIHNTSCQSWSIACYLLQWQWNTTKNKLRSPYESFFLKKPHVIDGVINLPKKKLPKKFIEESITTESDIEELTLLMENGTDEESNSSHTDEELSHHDLCHICKIIVLKKYRCIECNKTIHMYCGEKCSRDSVYFKCFNCTSSSEDNTPVIV